MVFETDEAAMVATIFQTMPDLLRVAGELKGGSEAQKKSFEIIDIGRGILEHYLPKCEAVVLSIVPKDPESR